MSATRQLFLMGTVAIQDGDERLEQFRSHRAVALLSYLVCQTQPIPRSELVELIWPDKSKKRGRANLRWALNYLGKLLPDCWVVSRQAVLFEPGERCWVDVLALEQALLADDVAGLNTAVGASEGTFCRGFYFNESPEFETWLLTQREWWRLRQIEAYNRLIAHHTSHGAYDKALPFARQLQTLELWDETAQRQVMSLLAHMGDYNQALAEYKKFKEVLKQEFKVKPSLETKRLRQRVLWARQAPRHNLPQRADTFVGRAAELAHLQRWLHEDTTRLITISGVGGTGKTCLGLAAARQALPHFLNGVVFVSLETVDKAADLPATLLQTLVKANFIPPPALGQESEPYLFDQLREREMLLFFDNYEQLLPQTEFLQRLLDSAPHLKLLVTSRERLRLRQEQLFQISGLTDMADAQRLFLMRAQPVLTSEVEGVVQEICRLVDNLPLAIELAAGWAHVQKLSEIVTELQRGLDILVARFRDQEPRHVSMEAVFEQSWQRLHEDERQLLLHLPAFQAPFTAESALAVGLATRRELASLLDKALVRRQEDRFQLHPLLQQFILAKWTPAVKHEARDRHLAFFMGFIAEYQSGLSDYPEAKVMDMVAEVLPDIIMAWKWACLSQREDAFQQMQLALRSYFSMRGPLQTGVELFQTAAKRFSIETDIGLNLRLSTASLLQKWGRHKSAQEAIAELLPHEEKLSASDAGLAHHIMAVCLYMTGAYGEARLHSERVLAYGVAADDMGLESLAYGLLGVIALAGIDFDDQGVFQEHDWRPELLDVAIERFEQSLQMARQVNELSRIVTNLHNLGYCRWRALDFPAASALFQQALHIAEQAGSHGPQTRNWLAVAQASMENYAEAELTARQALREAWEVQSLHVVMDILSTLGAKIFMHVGRVQEAIALLTFVAEHPRTDARIVHRSRVALSELRETVVSEEVFITAVSTSLTLDQIVATYAYEDS